MEKVSIVVPVYNMGDKIEICVCSLMEQTYKNIEIILVDDGSKDDSYQHCLHLADIDSRIKVLHTENRGSGPARNYGIQHASGKYVYFPDADDYLESNAIARMVEAMEISSCDLVVFGFHYANQRGEVFRTKSYDDSWHNGESVRVAYEEYMAETARYWVQGAPWNKFFDMQIIKKHGIQYPSLRRHQDEGFISRYMCYVQKIHFIEDVLYTYYVNDLQKEWQKYPIDYIDAVMGLYQVRKETIYTWNPEDKKTHDLIEQEYICKVIKALELSFSPKMSFNRTQRKQWIQETIKKSGISSVCIPETLGKYQRIIMNMIKKMHWTRVYALLCVKVRVESSSLYTRFKNRKRN